MKNTNININLLGVWLRRSSSLLFVFLFLFVSNLSLISHIVKAAAPGLVTTTGALGVEKTRATLEGITSLSDTTERGFEYGTTTGYGQTIQDTTPETEFATVVHTAATGDDAPYKIAIDTNDDIIAVSSSNIVKYSSSGEKLFEFSGYGTTDGLVQNPGSVDTDSLNNIYVADTGNNRIQKFDSSGNFVLAFGLQGSADGEFESPQGVFLDGSDMIYVADTGNNRIQKFDSSGNFILAFGVFGVADGELKSPVSVATDSLGNIYTAESYSGDPVQFRIQKFDPTGAFLLKWEEGGNSSGSLWYPIVVKLDSYDNVYLINNNQQDIQKFDSSGTYIEGWSGSNDQGSGDNKFSESTGDLDFDSEDNLYIADAGNIRVQRSGSSIQADLTTLACSTQYHVRAYAVSNSVTYYGQDKDFTTLDCVAGDGLQFVTDQLPDLEWDTTNGIGFLYYDTTIEATDNDGPPVYEVIEGNLPSGLTLDGSNGQLSGWASESGLTPDTTYSFTVAAYNDNSKNITKQFSIYVPPIPAISFPDIQLPDVTQNVYYSTYLDLLFERSAITTTLAAGSLPPGLYLNEDDLGQYVNIRGTATQAGDWTFTIQSTDGNNTATKEYTLTVLPYTPTPPVAPQTLVTITSPQPSSQVTGSEVTLQGKAPANKLVELYVDDVHVGGTTANASGDWQYVAYNLSPGVHQFAAKYTPEKRIMYVPATNQNGSQNPVDWQANLETVDTATGNIVDSFGLPAGILISGIAVNSDGTKVYLSTLNFRDYSGRSASPTQRVYEYSPGTGTLEIVNDSVLPEGVPSTGAVLSPDGTKAYINNYNSVKVIDLQTKQVVQSIEVIPFSPNIYVIVGENVLSPDGVTLSTVFIEITVNQNGGSSIRLKLKTTNTTTLVSSETLLSDNYQPSEPFLFPKLIQGKDRLYIVYLGGDTSNARVDYINPTTQDITTIITADMIRGADPDLYLTSAVLDTESDGLYLSVLIGDFAAIDPFATFRGGYVRINTDLSRTDFLDAEAYEGTGISGIYYDNTTQTIHKPAVVRFDDPYSGLKAETFDIQNGTFSYSDTDVPMQQPSSYNSNIGNSFGGSEPAQYAYRNVTTVAGQISPPTDSGTTDPDPVLTTIPEVTVDTDNTPEALRIEPLLSGEDERVPTALLEEQSQQSPIDNVATKQRDQSGVQRSIEQLAKKLGISPQTLVTAIPWFVLGILMIFVAILTMMLIYQLYIIGKIRLLVKRQQLLNHEKRSLISLSSHYLRTPLTILSAGIDTLPAESGARQKIQTATDELRTVISAIIGRIESDSQLEKTWRPTKEKIQRMRILQPRLVIPVAVTIGTIGLFNFAVANSTNFVISINGAWLQAVAVVIVATILYFVYDSIIQHRIIERYHSELLEYHASLDSSRNRFLKEVAEDLVPAVMAVDSAVPAGLPEETVKIMKSGLQQFEATAKDFILISQLEQKQLRQKATDITLKNVVTGALAATERSGKAVDTSGLQPTKVHQPEFLLRRVVSSLVENATTHGESTQPVVISSSKSGAESTMSITDYGKGIEKDRLSLLFKPLSRVEEAEDFTHEGVGLSLYVNRLIMHYLGGEITAQSRLGKGTTMSVFIPTGTSK